jgi:tetratricopeptide (TPR) repeat protein
MNCSSGSSDWPTGLLLGCPRRNREKENLAMKRAMLIAAALWTLSAGIARSIDTIYMPGTDNKEKAYFGKISSMTATVINFQPQRTGPNVIQANEVTRIVFENSPESLTNAQKDILALKYQDAIDRLRKERPEAYRKEVAEEINYCRAYCAAQLALSGNDDLNQAATQMKTFIANSPANFHYLKACELMGDICVALGQFAEAEKCYDKLTEAPWPDYKIRAQVALGRSYLAQNNAALATAAFDEALNNDAPGELADVQRMAARIGKARCMVLAGKTDEALRDLNEVLERTNDKNAEVVKYPELAAMAYNAQGTALRKAGKPKEAILAFLHVHLYYSTLPDPDAEAVANLERLFSEDKKPDHAREMRAVIAEKYKNSRWAKGVK